LPCLCYHTLTYISSLYSDEDDGGTYDTHYNDSEAVGAPWTTMAERMRLKKRGIYSRQFKSYTSSSSSSSANSYVGSITESGPSDQDEAAVFAVGKCLLIFCDGRF
jgi:hypothetical protein